MDDGLERERGRLCREKEERIPILKT